MFNKTLFVTSVLTMLIGSDIRAGDSPSDLLPPDTYFYVSLNDLSVMAKSWESMPLGRISQEQEVQDFLKQPMEMLKGLVQSGLDEMKQEEAFKDLDIKPEDLVNTNYKSIFAGLTQLDLAPDVVSAPPIIGLVVGVEPLEGTRDPMMLILDIIRRAAEEETDVSIEKGEHGGVAYEWVSVQEPGVPEFCFAKIGVTSLFTVSKAALHGVIDRSKSDDAATLSASKDYGELAAKLDGNVPAAATFFVDIDRMLEKVKLVAKTGMEMESETQPYAAKFDELWADLGVDCMGSALSTWISGDNVGRIRSVARLKSAPTGLVETLMPKPVDLGKLSLIPSTASGCSLSHVNVAGFFEAMMAMVKKADENAYNEMQQMVGGMAQMLGAPEGFDLHKDFIAGFGTECLTYSTPSEGMMAAGDFVVMMETVDSAKVLGGMKMMMAAPGAMAQMPINLKETPFKDATLYAIDVSAIPGAEMAATFVQPTFTFVDKYMIFGLNQKSIKSMINRMAGEGTGDDIRSREDFKRFFGKLPDKPTSLSYSDIKSTFESGYNGLIGLTVMPPFSDVLADLPIDMALLPTSDSVAQHLFGSLTFSTVSNNEIMMESYGPLGSEMLPMLGGVMLTAMGAGAAVQSGNMAMPPGMIDSAPAPEEMSDFDRVYADLGALKAAITVYQLDRGELPGQFQDLITPNENYPEGYLTGGKILTDPWGNAYRYEKTGRSEYRLWSIGPDGVDEKGGGDDVAVSR